MHERADVVVVGAGPAGSAVATFLAQLGWDVALLEKETFPRDKVCGDGLTPRAVKALQLLGLHAEAAGNVVGWQRQDGLRMYGGGVVWDLPWPQVDGFPAHSVTATRSLFDHTLAQHAVAAGARLCEGIEATGPLGLDHATTRVAGVSIRDAEGRDGTVRAPLVVVADGASSRFSVALGVRRDERRPMGVAVRGYYRSPRSAMGVMEGFLDLRKGEELLPGYGWIFPLADGLVNVGFGLISTSKHFRTTNYRQVLTDWVSGLPKEWEMNPATAVGKPRSAGLPMAHNRHPHVASGCVLLGDAGGMVNPFNGEGISYAIEAAAMAAEAIDSALRTHDESALEAYPRELAKAWGGYFTLGRVFLNVMGHPSVMRVCANLGLPRRVVTDFTFKTMAHLLNPRPRDFTDALIGALSKAVPAS